MGVAMRCLILGGGRAVFSEAEASRKLFTPDMVVAVNDIGALVPDIDHWTFLHPEIIDPLVTRRAASKLPMDYKLWCDRENDSGATIFPDYDPSGLGGLYAVKLARHLGADKIVLAGVPMDRSGHFTGDQKKHWISTDRRQVWEEQFEELRLYVRSMSGWTLKLFGAPTREWLGLKELA